MRESCSCGAAIHTLFYTRALTWRLTHNCENAIDQAEVTSQVELATGFQPNPLYDEDWDEEARRRK